MTGWPILSTITFLPLAGAGFAGQFESFLGLEDEQEFITAVRACWGALWATRALRYMATHDLDPAECLVELGPAGAGANGDNHGIDESDIEAFLEAEGDTVALVLWPGVQYATGQAFDLARIAKAAHAAGAKVGFDLAHGAGNVPLSLHDSGCDFAAWCSYKYLNAGAGAVAGCFVHERHGGRDDLPRFHGWWGHDPESRFKMGHDFVPAPGADAWQLSNPPIFQLAALRASLEIFDEATMPALRARSEKLTAYLESRLHAIEDDRISIITPSDPAQRGCQLSIRVKDADRSLFDAVTARGAVADWREPDVIRVAPVPLYNTFADIDRFAEILAAALALR